MCYDDFVNVRDSYHHGDLKATLLALALVHLERDGHEALSLRALAKEAGVSPNAPYRHFADKQALLASVAAEGFRLFAEDILAASRQPSPRRALRDEFTAYLSFAAAHPALYNLMFSAYGYSLHSADCGRFANEAFGCLIETTVRCQADGWRPESEPTSLVLALWSSLHGWATLTGDRLVPPEVPLPTVEIWLREALPGLNPT